MKGSKFAKSLELLDGWQLNRFYEQVKANYKAKQNSAPFLLMEVVKPHFGTSYQSNTLSAEKVMSRKKLAKKIGSKAAYNKTLHLLLNELEDFVVVENILNDSFHRNRILSQWYATNNKTGLAEKLTAQSQAAISGEFDAHWMNYQMNYDILERDAFSTPKLLASDRALDEAYFLDKLTLTASLASRYQQYGMLEQLDEKYFQQLELLEQHVESDSAYIKITLLFFRGITDPAREEDILEATRLLVERGPEFNIRKQMEIATMIVTFYSSKIQQNKWEYAKQYMEVIDLISERGLLLSSDGIMMHSRYFNIVRILIGMEKSEAGITDWLYKFIDDYAPYLPPKDRKVFPDFCRGIVALRQQNDPEKAADYLMELKPNRVIFSILYRRELVVLFFLRTAEHKSFKKVLDAYIRNFDQFIRAQRKKVSGTLIRTLLGHIPAYKKLARCYFGPAEKIYDFVEWVDQNNPPDARWIRKQALSRLTSLPGKY